MPTATPATETADIIFIALGVLGFIQIKQKSDLPLRLIGKGDHIMILETNGLSIPGFTPEKFEVITVDGKLVSTKEDVEFVSIG